MSRRSMLSDTQWETVQPFLPAKRPWSGRPRRDYRQVAEGIIYRYRCGIAWRDLPADFGPWQTSPTDGSPGRSPHRMVAASSSSLSSRSANTRRTADGSGLPASGPRWRRASPTFPATAAEAGLFSSR